MGDITQVFVSAQVKFTLGNLIFSLGKYTLVKFIPGNPTKGNHTRVFISTKVLFTLGNLILFLGNNTLVILPLVTLPWVILPGYLFLPG